MQINLPRRSGNTNSSTIEANQLVIIGANGSGKTRFGHKLLKLNSNSIFIYSQKSLQIPNAIYLNSMEQAEHDFFDGNVIQINKHNVSNRENQKPNNVLDDFEQLLKLLFAEESVISTKFRKASIISKQIDIPKTRLDVVKEIWESIITHKKLNLDDLSINLSGYSGTEMSDGERLLLYIIGQVMSAKRNQIIIIDEPENHLHKSVIKKLYNQLENAREDCVFIYLTHDIDFAFTRESAAKIWTKTYFNNEIWDYEVLPQDLPLPEQLYLSILGSRKPVIFLEGDSSSLDYKIYEQVYFDYTIQPLGSCEKVIQCVKSFNEQRSFHNIMSFGIIDRDRRQDRDVKNLNDKNIWVLDVAEVENLLLIEPIVKAIALRMHKDANSVFNQVKQNIIEFFTRQLSPQILLHFKETLRQNFISLSNFTHKTIEDVIIEIDSNYSNINKEDLYEDVKNGFKDIIKRNDYNSILRVFNFKKVLIINSKVCELTGIKDKDEYIKLAIAMLKKKDTEGASIRNGIDNKILKI